VIYAWIHLHRWLVDWMHGAGGGGGGGFGYAEQDDFAHLSVYEAPLVTAEK
jgi:hypothetical protein